MKKKWSILILIIVLIGLVIEIVYKNYTKTDSGANNNNFKIVTTFYPIYVMAENIVEGAQNVELVNMTDANVGCLHDYTILTSDMKKIEKADVIIQNGLGLENFMDKILNTYSNIKVIDSSKNINYKIEKDDEVNGHIWTSLTNYIEQIKEIADRLSEINPANKEIYQKNKNSYIKEISQLKEKYDIDLSNLKRKKGNMFK